MTYTIQRLDPSGDAFLLYWPYDRITRYAGPLTQEDIDWIQQGDSIANDWDMDDNEDQLETLNTASWQFPIYTTE